MAEKTLRILLVEDDPAQAMLAQSHLDQAVATRFEVSVATTLRETTDALAGEGFDAVLLDLDLPDSQGIETFRKVQACVPQTPIIVLSCCEDESVALNAVREGAQDYLVKGQIRGAQLARAIRWAVERRVQGGKKGRVAKVFISCKGEDRMHGKAVYDFLTSRGMEVFYYDESLPRMGDADFRRAIDTALDMTDHLVVVTSSADHARSPWVEAEWGIFVQEKRSARKLGNLITLVVGNVRPADLPPSLRYYEILPLTPEGLERLSGFLPAIRLR